MKHIELFENFSGQESGANETVLIGYFADGGKGSHPALVTPEVAREIEETGDFPTFTPTGSEKGLPQALACVYNDTDEWTIKGIPESLARSAMVLIKGDHIDNSETENRGLVNEVAKLIGYRETDDREVTLISIIPNPSINTVYWSEGPESGTYWEPPYEAIPVRELMG